MSFISLLKRWLRNRRPRHFHARIRDYRRELSNSRQAVRRWKTEYLGQRSLNKQLRARISSLKYQRDRARQHKRQVLYPVILHQIGNSDGETVLMRSKYIGGHRILPEGSRPKHRQLVTVPRYTLDSWVRRLLINVDEIAFVKSALACVGGTTGTKTDILVYHASGD